MSNVKLCLEELWEDNTPVPAKHPRILPEPGPHQERLHNYCTSSTFKPQHLSAGWPEGLAKGVSAKHSGSRIHWVPTIIQCPSLKRGGSSCKATPFTYTPLGSVRLCQDTGEAEHTLPAVWRKEVQHYSHVPQQKTPQTYNLMMSMW